MHAEIIWFAHISLDSPEILAIYTNHHEAEQVLAALEPHLNGEDTHILGTYELQALLEPFEGFLDGLGELYLESHAIQS